MKPLFIFGTLLLLISCGTGDQPIVDLVSVEVQDDGSVKMEGRLDFKGDDLQQLGFCFDTMPDPRPNSTGNLNHTQGVLDGKKFTGDFPWFDAYQKYYFRAYAVTFEGDYVFSGQSVLDTIHAKRVVPTCNPTFGRINLGTTNIQYVSSAETPELGIYGYEIEVRTNNNWFDIEFGEYPISGIYKTTQQDPEENEIRIAIFGPGGGVLDGGTNVYINQLGPKKWNMVICDAKYTFVNAKLTFSSNFDFPK